MELLLRALGVYQDGADGQIAVCNLEPLGSGGLLAAVACGDDGEAGVAEGVVLRVEGVGGVPHAVLQSPAVSASQEHKEEGPEVDNNEV